MSCRKMNKDVAYARNTESGCTQVRANTRISHTEFIYDQCMRLQMAYIWASCLE